VKTKFTAFIATATLVGAAHAGEIQREPDRSQILFEDGTNYVEVSGSLVLPRISGTLGGGALSSGNMTGNYQSYTFGYKREVNEKLSFAIVANQPYGADVSYPAGTPYPFSGSNAALDTFAITGLVKYNITDRFSAYGGLRLQSMKGNLNITFPVAYTLNVNRDWQVGYLLGAAYQIPDIAMKVALTYESEIEHEFSDNAGAPFQVKTPQAVTLHAQSGIAKNTLLFGSVRWQEWTEFQIAPNDFLGGTVPIARGASDIWTYELGVGQRFNDNWSGAFTIGYEEDKGDVVGNLSGKDGFVSYGLAVKYETEDWEITTGVRYIDVGSANTTIGANFSGNSAFAFGTKVGFRF